MEVRMPLEYNSMNRCVHAITSLIILAFSTPAFSSPHADVCDEAARIASVESGVPLPILRAITRTETGRHLNGVLSPWAWAINIEGSGYWFDSMQAAEEQITANLQNGTESIDIGCFQINFRWHGEAFANVKEMLSPVANARYAAKLLAQKFRETGDWSRAAGAYHSNTPEFAERYMKRFDQVYSSVSQSNRGLSNRSRIETTQNGFPLLIRDNGNTHMGSLVPMTRSGRGNILFGQSGKG
jgi:hypothetical protein